MATNTSLVPFIEPAIRQAAHEALWRRPDGSARDFDDALVAAIRAEAEAVAEMFRPAAGYLTTDEQLDTIVATAIEHILGSVRLEIEHVFTVELQRVPPPEFVAPPAGWWVAERHAPRRGPVEVGTWHRASGRTEAQPWAVDRWPRLVASCGERLDTSWHDDGSSSTGWLLVADEPSGACGRCRRIPLREPLSWGAPIHGRA